MTKKALILTVGLEVNPILSAIRNVRPEIVTFLCTDGSGGSQAVVFEVLPVINEQLRDYTIKLIQDRNDLSECYSVASNAVQLLKQNYTDYELYADYSGGTKSMSVGLTLAALEHKISLWDTQLLKTISFERITRLNSRDIPKFVAQKTENGFNINCITALRVGRFKAFADIQQIPLRPITLIYGSNSSGKSSVIHSLLLAHHAIKNNGELDVYRTEAGGESVDLGGFGQYVHRRDRRSQVEWAVDLDPRQITLLDRSLTDLLQSVQKLKVGVTIGIGVGTGADNEQVGVRSFYIEADGREMLIMSARRDGILRLDRLNYKHPVIKKLIEAIVETTTTSQRVRSSDYEGIEQAINELVPEFTSKVSGLLPNGIQSKEFEDKSSSDSIIPVSSEKRQEALAAAMRLFLPRRLSELMSAIAEGVERDISKLRYLGPFRTYPPRHFAFSRQQDINWYAGGGYAWDMLLNNAEVREKVNAWLGDSDRMKAPYELVVRNLLPDSQLSIQLAGLLQKGFHDLAAKLILYAVGFGDAMHKEVQQLASVLENDFIDFDEPNLLFSEIDELVSSLTDTDSLSESWAREMTAESDLISDLVLIDKRTKTPVSHRDVGIGVSQVIPILVSCYGLSDALVAIEQPEIHLHPRLQAELGSLFAESIKPPYYNRFILETHSEHLMLRIQKLIRKGNLSVNDISVVYVDCTREGSHCLELRLDEEGDFIDEWPDGFFEEDFREIFS